MLRPMQLQNKDNTKKMMYIDDTGQIYKDDFTFRKENPNEKKRRKTYQRNEQYVINLSEMNTNY